MYKTEHGRSEVIYAEEHTYSDERSLQTYRTLFHAVRNFLDKLDF